MKRTMRRKKTFDQSDHETVIIWIFHTVYLCLGNIDSRNLLESIKEPWLESHKVTALELRET